MNRFFCIDILKGLFCLSIFIGHAIVSYGLDPIIGQNMVPHYASFFSAPVSFFFCVSGFLAGSSCGGGYFKMIFHRLKRLYPLHLLTLLFSVCMFLATGRVLAGYQSGLSSVLPSLLFIHDWVPFHPELRQAWNGVSWFLSALFFCILLSPIIFREKEKVSIYVLGLFAVALSVVTINRQGLLFDVSEWVYFFPPTRFLEFALGSIVADAVSRKNYLVLICLMLSIISVVAVCMGIPFSGLGFVASPMFAVVLYLLVRCEKRGLLTSVLECGLSRCLVMLGKISFEFYMVHAIVIALTISVLHKCLESYPLWLLLLSAASVSCACSCFVRMLLRRLGL